MPKFARWLMNAAAVTVLACIASLAFTGIVHASTVTGAAHVTNKPYISYKSTSIKTTASAPVAISGTGSITVGIAAYSCEQTCTGTYDTQKLLAWDDQTFTAGSHVLAISFATCGKFQADVYIGTVIRQLSDTNLYGPRRLYSRFGSTTSGCKTSTPSPTPTPTSTPTKPVTSTTPVVVKTTSLAPVVHYSQPAPPSLPYTGSNIVQPVVEGTSLFVFGALLVLASRRRLRRIRGQHS